MAWSYSSLFLNNQARLVQHQSPIPFSLLSCAHAEQGNGNPYFPSRLLGLHVPRLASNLPYRRHALNRPRTNASDMH